MIEELIAKNLEKVNEKRPFPDVEAVVFVCLSVELMNGRMIAFRSKG